MLYARHHTSSGWQPLTSDDPAISLSNISSSFDGELIWIRAHDPAPDELLQLGETTGLPISQEFPRVDGTPRIESHNGTTTVVLRTLSYFDEDSAVETGLIAVIVQPERIVTLDWNSSSIIRTVDQMLHERMFSLDIPPEWRVLHAILAAAVIEYSQVEHALSDDVSDMENLVFSSEKTDPIERIYELKREVAEARRTILPFLDPIHDLAAGSVEGFPSELHHVATRTSSTLGRILDRIESHDRLLGDMLSAYFSIVSMQQNSDTRKISAWAAMITVPTLIAGIYGMNFAHMPELSWFLGYPGAVGLMVAACLVLYWLFKRSGWL